MPSTVKISPSLQCAPILELGQSVRTLMQAGADMLHIDVMDGRFVPNFALNIDLIEALHRFTPLPTDVHFMVEQPREYILRAMDAGAAQISFHVEAVREPMPLLTMIRKGGCAAGLALSPQTPVSVLAPFLGAVDFVQVMAVQPGFSGQSFLPETLGRITELSALRARSGLAFQISVDGGIDAAWGTECLQRGVDILIAGAKCMFREGHDLADDALAFIQAMREEAARALK